MAKFSSKITAIILDRSRNPSITPKVMREVVLHQRMRTSRIFLSNMKDLYKELAISTIFSAGLEDFATSIDEG